MIIFYAGTMRCNIVARDVYTNGNGYCVKTKRIENHFGNGKKIKLLDIFSPSFKSTIKCIYSSLLRFTIIEIWCSKMNSFSYFIAVQYIQKLIDLLCSPVHWGKKSLRQAIQLKWNMVQSFNYVTTWCDALCQAKIETKSFSKRLLPQHPILH